MQPITGGPRSELTREQVLEVLQMEHGAKVRSGVDILTTDGTLIESVQRLETTDADWNAGTISGGLVEDGDFIIGG